ncbi:molybdopterin-dependent oxidoreductase [Rhizobium leguminosarum]|uniref:Molybdopterin-dependent oxidoreductase n=1 Tax=Rhizobium leguminosarum TaxID=384 RepID=A0A6P0B8Z4_RHILE|nr:molybdopterin cofactor-binding domain-containing protein [Rhizobium leguminosarum]NEI35888.1 molybdopterin-dependent oxidoreductase [Rhizobium leguminosarum]NEI42271.1 molybdopterin-dependent oxidoreductase [Rhizobium leguminosarum]
MTESLPPGSLSIYDEFSAGPAVFLRMDERGVATGYNGHVDLGTGIDTALSQIVAEELDLPLSAVHMVLGDTASTPDQGPTIASETIQVAAIPLRLAAAQARLFLVTEAARRFNAPIDGIAIEAGCLGWQDKSCGYGDLIAGQDVALKLDRTTPVKPPANYRIVGHRTGRRDLSDKLRGTHPYIHDVDIAGMVHGHVIRPPYAGRDSGTFVGHSLIRYDEAAVRNLPGFIAVVRHGDFLGVVAERADQAQAIAEALPAHWHLPPDMPDMTELRETLKHHPSTPRSLDRAGDFGRAIAECDVARQRTYVWPYHEHGSIGPSCAIADWNGGTPLVWSGTQNPHMLRDDLAVLVGVPTERIEIRRYQAAGCYGRNCADDVCGDALLLSRATSRPVRVQLTRAQEHLWEPKGAAQLMEVNGGLKAGALHAYAIDTWYPSNRGPNLSLLLTGRISSEARPSDMGDRTIIPPYRVPHRRITVHDMAPIVRAAWMRGVSALPNTFAHESFVDEMAYEAGEDPVAFRLRHLDDPREADLVRRTAEQAGWAERVGPRLRREGGMAFGQGFAFATYVHGTFPGTAAASAAWVVDVAVDTETGEVALTRIFIGQDQGLVINPDGVRQQIHGNAIQTASRVLLEEVTFNEISPTPRSWAAYPIQTFPAVPEIETMLIARPDDPPLGVGESAAVPSAAAIANAIFDATGVRMREVPFTPEKMRAALAASGTKPALAAAEARPRRSRSPLRKKLIGLGAVIGGMLAMGTIALPLNRSVAPSAAPASGTFSKETLERGRQVFALGNCATCHTADGGLPNAGGRPMVIPFGTVYSTNITPEPETGLGRWSFEAFERAMRHGISRDGHNLYPVFPYTSFAKIGSEDMLSLYAYIQTLTPVRQETLPSRMIAPTNLRPALAVWNWLYHDATPFTPDPVRSETWNRGKYLVEAAGHCSACHAPRNIAGAELPELTGAMIKGWYAPALAGPLAAARGWNEDTLFSYLRRGHSEAATASGPMAEVAASLTALPDGDIRAMATYLASLSGIDTATALSVPEARLAPSRASRIYESACAVCHEPALAGTVTAALAPISRSAALRAPVPDALFSVLDEGLKAPDGLDLRDMPSFHGEFTETEREALASYLRQRFAPDLPPW